MSGHDKSGYIRQNVYVGKANLWLLQTPLQNLLEPISSIMYSNFSDLVFHKNL